MRSQKIKRFSILIIRTELDDLLAKLIELGCVQPDEATEFSPQSELHALTKLEIIDLERFYANKKSISAIGSKCAIFLTGYILTKFEAKFVSIADNFVCAWQIDDIPAEDYDLAPVELNRPRFFGKYRLAGRTLFEPLKSNSPYSDHFDDDYQEEEDIYEEDDED